MGYSRQLGTLMREGNKMGLAVAFSGKMIETRQTLGNDASLPLTFPNILSQRS
jgi:hypothetical protein